MESPTNGHAAATADGKPAGAPPSNRSLLSVIKCTLIGVFGYVVAFTIIDMVQRQRGTAQEGAANPNNLPALQMVVAHFTSQPYHHAIKQLAGEILRMELFWFSVIYIIAQRPIRTYFQYGKHYNDNKKWWKKIMWNYNLSMSAFSFCTLSGSAYAVLRYGIMSDDCSILFRDPIFYYTVYAFYLSKFVEYADTFWLLLMNQPISWLQWFHHIGAPFNMWLLYRSQGEPVWIFVLFNSFIHTLMYIYYAYAVIGKKVMPKQILTSLQILQFSSGFFILWEYRHIACFGNDAIRMFGTFYFTYFYVGAVLMLFMHFFYVNYVRAPKKSKSAGAVTNGKHENGTNGTANGSTNGHHKPKPRKDD